MGEVCQNAGFQLLLGSVSLTEWISPSKMDSGAEIGQDIQPEGGILGLIDEDMKSSFLLREWLSLWCLSTVYYTFRKTVRVRASTVTYRTNMRGYTCVT